MIAEFRTYAVLLQDKIAYPFVKWVATLQISTKAKVFNQQITCQIFQGSSINSLGLKHKAPFRSQKRASPTFFINFGDGNWRQAEA